MPSRDLVVIHPDLDYTEALGAVAGTLPDLHPDVVVGLVDQVTPRPKYQSRTRRLVPVLSRMSLAAMGAAVIMFLSLGPASTASANARFGAAWQEQMARMGMSCSVGEDDLRTCVDADREVTEVRGFRRDHSSLYMLWRQEKASFMLIFDAQEYADHYAERHPGVEMVGRVAVW